jgi:hypothetical protein
MRVSVGKNVSLTQPSTHVVVYQVLDSPPVTGRKLHDFPFQLPFRGIA